MAGCLYSSHEVITFVCRLDVLYVADLALNKAPKITTTRAPRKKVTKATEVRATGNLLSVRAFWMRKYLYRPGDKNENQQTLDLHEKQKAKKNLPITNVTNPNITAVTPNGFANLCILWVVTDRSFWPELRSVVLNS